MMKALWLHDQVLSLRDDVQVPEPENGEALIRVSLAGICSTDLEMVRGYYAFNGIPGHEFVGEVVAAPGQDGLAGQRVVGEINIFCGRCACCLANMRTHCENRSVLGILDHDGVFSEYVVLPLENLHRVPVDIPDEVAVFTEPLAAAVEIQEQVLVQPGTHVLVIGAGRLGQLVARTLVLTGCELEVIARHDLQKKLLADCHVKTISEEMIVEDGYDLVVDTSGTPVGFSTAKKAVRPRGTVVLKSTYYGDSPMNLSDLVVKEITLVGSRCGPFPPALRLLERGLIDPRSLVDDIYPLSEGLSAYRHAAQPGVLKILLRPAD
jgi:threonine dehydrogenase-like Zn-dependent dehydrogenase